MNEQEQLPYFAPLLPWQRQAWQQLTGQFIEQRMPHGLLAAGQKGIGKREFVWRFVAYLLCLEKTNMVRVVTVRAVNGCVLERILIYWCYRRVIASKLMIFVCSKNTVKPKGMG